MQGNAIERSLFISRIQAICDEMGAVLQRSAFSPNIRDRLDFSCALFDAGGKLCAQAAHIPVHLGSMAYALEGIVNRFQWQPGDMVILNDPYLGGTHLPDVTLIAPIFSGNRLHAFAVNRAHHADIGGATPGSMPLSRHLDEEGIVIPPKYLMRNNRAVPEKLDDLFKRLHSPATANADFNAQISANRRGVVLLGQLIDRMGPEGFQAALDDLNGYAGRLAQSGIRDIPDGRFEFTDVMDDDGLGGTDIRIKVTLYVSDNRVAVDFSGTSRQVEGNINCPLSVTAAAVYYCFYCLMPAHTPACAGTFKPIEIRAPEACLVNARYPAAVAAGNVETSTRLVDVVLGALAKAIPGQIPAASHGSMNNIAMGSNEWDYYETLGGGMGAGAASHGVDAVQTHMTNTRNTPIEVLELHYPLRIKSYRIRRGSGGDGLHHGGNGLIREFQFLRKTTVTLLTERRLHPPWGLNGGGPAKTARNLLNGKVIPGKTRLEVKQGDILTIETAGGGGWGVPGTRNQGLGTRSS